MVDVITVPDFTISNLRIVPRRAAWQVGEQFTAERAASGREQTGEQAGSGGQRSRSCMEVQGEEEKENNTDDERTRPEVCPGSALYLQSLADCTFEGYMKTKNSISPKGVSEATEGENEENLEQNASFLEYLDQLCSDKNFFREVESMLSKEFLDFLLSAEAELPDLLALEKQAQESLKVIQLPHVSSDSNSVSPAALQLAPPQSDTKTNHDAPRGRTGPQEGWTPGSPLLTSVLQEEALPTADATPPFDKNGSLFMDFTSSLQFPAPNTSCISALEAQSATKLQKGLLESIEHPLQDHAPSLRGDFSPRQSVGLPALSVLALRRLYHPLPLIRKPEELHSPKTINSAPANWSFMADSHADSLDPSVESNLSHYASVKQTVLQTAFGASESSELQAETVAEMQTEEKKEKPKRTTNIRRSQRLSDQIEKAKARLSGALITERENERKSSEKRVKKTTILTPERETQKRRPFRGRRLFTTEENHFEEAEKAANTAEQFLHTGDEEASQKLTGEMQKQEEEEHNDPSLSSEPGAENDEKNFNFAGCNTNENKVSAPECPPQSPKVQTDTRSTKDSQKEAKNESSTVKTCEKNTDLTSPESKRQRKTAALREGEGESEVTGNKTLYFYSLRPKRTVNIRTGVQEATYKPSNSKLPAGGRDGGEGINGEEESVALSPMKRCRNERETRVKEEVETKMNSLSPVKRGRWKSRAEGEEKQKLAVNEKGEKRFVKTPAAQRFHVGKPKSYLQSMNYFFRAK
ncbi:uncharacterized protein LOC131990062 isoform X2 [Centropristis striata]|uniref:uncharacterized protein LOC131990062 isoform X2 n=1 Tax=Centropristis striata TaxID=184440 RepID=UPI0027DEFEAF|nr:uncharacterized protein LOC131990062 isoform X2 [Centropristis striata]